MADEICVLLRRRRCSRTAGGRASSAGPGRALFVPACEDRRSPDVTEGMAVPVFFVPPHPGRP